MPVRYRLALCCVAALSAGCSSIPDYQQPEGESAAKLRVVVPNPEQFALRLATVDLTTCKPAADIGWVSGGARVDTARVGMLDTTMPRDGVLERRVAPDRPMAVMPWMTVALFDAATILFSMNPATQGAIQKAQAGVCAVPVFSPKPGEEYELSIKMAAGGRCTITLSLLSIDEGKVSRTPVKETGWVSLPAGMLPAEKKLMECDKNQPQATASSASRAA